MRFLPAVEMTDVSREKMEGGAAAAAKPPPPHLPNAINGMESFRPQGEISPFI